MHGVGRLLVIFLVLYLSGVVGCSSKEKLFDVTGKVTYQGQPVGEGDVQLIDEKTGRGAQVALQADGTYIAQLPAGLYQVVVTPPYLVDNSGIPNPKYKKVNNIPKKYHSTSGLTAEVKPDKTMHNFELVP